MSSVDLEGVLRMSQSSRPCINMYPLKIARPERHEALLIWVWPPLYRRGDSTKVWKLVTATSDAQ